MREETIRQGEDYSRKIREQYSTLWNDPFWDYVRLKRVEFILKSLTRHKIDKANVLEVGCGIGFTTIALAKSKRISSIDAIDMSREAMKEALRLQGLVPEVRKCVFEIADFYDFCPAHTSAYDLIYMHEVIEHMGNPYEVFNIVFNSLRPDGLFMISTPNKERLENRLRRFFGKKLAMIDLYHVKEFTFPELVSLGNKCGFKLIDKGGAILFSGSPLKLPKFILKNRLNYFLGQIFPCLSREILILYRK